MPRHCLVAFALFVLLASGARAQFPNSTVDPGLQPPASGEEAPYIRTPQAVVDKMLALAEVGADDYLIDLGSGDGRIVLAAAQQRGARGFGVELDPRLVDASNAAARKAGVAGRVQFFARDLFETDISQASVLTLYLLPEINLQLRPRLLAQLKPGTRVVSHDWDMGEWPPDAKAVLERSISGSSPPGSPVPGACRQRAPTRRRSSNSPSAFRRFPVSPGARAGAACCKAPTCADRRSALP